MRRVAIVQARMTSSRLPGKVLADLDGRPMLAQQLRRLTRCTRVDDLVVATTTNAADDGVVDLAGREGVSTFRGSESDVLARYLGAARDTRADVVVRLTADCPLIVPEIVDRVIERLMAGEAVDYASNTIRRTYPRGCDVEVFFRDVLERVHRFATSAPAREHVTYLIARERPELFVTASVEDTTDNSDLRWTVDTEDDLRMVREMYDSLDLGVRDVPYEEMVRHARDNPALIAINAHVEQRER